MSQSLSLDVVLNTIDRASAPLRNINKASNRTADQLKDTRTQLKQLQRQQKDISSFRELQKASKQVRNEFAESTERTNRLSKELAQTSTPTKKLIRDFDRAKAATHRLRQQHINHLQTLRRTRSALQETGVDTRDLTATQRGLTRSIEQTDRALQSHQQQLDTTRRRQERLNRARQGFQNNRAMAGNLAGAGMTSVAGGTATMLAAAKTASVGMDFDAQMSKVQALTRLKKDSQELQDLRMQARTLGATTMFTASDAASGQSFLAMAGFTPKKIKEAMPGILDMAASAGVDIATAANIGSNILSGFSKDASEMSKVGDVLTSAFTRGNVDLMMLGETMKYVAPVAKGLGVDIELTAAMAAKLGDAGIQSSMAGTGLKAILSRLSAGPKMAKAALAELGVKSAKANGDMRPMLNILVDLDKATKHLGDTQRQEALKNIAGAEAVSSLMVLVDRAGKGELRELHENIQKDIGISKKTADIMADNASGDLKSLVSSIQDVAIEMTSLNNGSLRELIQNLTSISRGVGTWIKQNPELAATIGKVVTISGALLLGFGALALAASALLMPFAMLRFSFTAIGLTGGRFLKGFKKIGKGLMWLGRVAFPFVGKALLAIGRAFLMTPIGLLVTTFATAGYLIYKNWDSILWSLKDIWKKLSNAWDKTTGYISMKIGDFIDTTKSKWKAFTTSSSMSIGDFVDNTKTNLATLSSSWKNTNSTISMHIGDFIDTTKAEWKAFITSKSISIGDTIDSAKAEWQRMGLAYEAGKNLLSTKLDLFKSKAKAHWLQVKTAFINGRNIISSTLSQWSPFKIIYDLISSALQSLTVELPKKFKEFGANLITGLTDGITSKAASLKKSITGVGDNISGWFKDKLNINSPSKVFIKHGSSVVEGLEQGLAKNHNTLKPIKKLTKQLKQAGVGLALASSAGLVTTTNLAAAPNIALDNRAPLSQQQASSNNGSNVVIEKIEIHAAPGMDEQALARLVAQEISKREQQQRSQSQSAFNDFD